MRGSVYIIDERVVSIHLYSNFSNSVKPNGIISLESAILKYGEPGEVTYTKETAGDILPVFVH